MEIWPSPGSQFTVCFRVQLGSKTRPICPERRVCPMSDRDRIAAQLGPEIRGSRKLAGLVTGSRLLVRKSSTDEMHVSGLRHSTNWSQARCLRAADSDSASGYVLGREPTMRISTSRFALCCQSGLVATLATPTSARRRSIGSRSLRMSPLLIARFTRERIASCI